MLAFAGGSYGAAPVNTVAPVVTGTTTVGQTLTTTDGTWTGAPAPTFTYQWFRSPSTSIGGATSSTYVLVAGDIGFGIFCRVRATNTIAPSGVTADSNTTSAIGGIAPVNTVAPVVSGTATVGQTLSTTDGTWTGTPAPTFTYQWQRSSSNIGGATSSTYVLVAADYANTIRCVVTATNSAAAVSANSNSTASVAGNAPVNTVAPSVTGTATFGQTLSTTDGTWTGVPTPTFTYQWQRSSSNIGGATSSTYVLVAADVGNTVRCVVTATNAVAAVSANSNSTATVAATVPDAPTIGTATATSSSTATVVYTAPANTGGSVITSYTATSSPSGITGTLSQAGSGTITVSGLTGNTSYTFTVTATNAAGTSAASAASNSITTPLAIGQAFGGGFYAGQIGVSGVATHNLVIGPRSTAQSFNLFWKNSNTTTVGADSNINGPQNTADMVADGNSTVYPAAHFCNDLSTGGETDWYMPARNELEVCYYNLKPTTASNSTSSGTNTNAVPSRGSNYTAGTPAQTSAAAFQFGGAQAFATDPYWTYWTSTARQPSSYYTSGRTQFFTNGGQYTAAKRSYNYYVRAVRRVAV